MKKYRTYSLQINLKANKSYLTFLRLFRRSWRNVQWRDGLIKDNRLIVGRLKDCCALRRRTKYCALSLAQLCVLLCNTIEHYLWVVVYNLHYLINRWALPSENRLSKVLHALRLLPLQLLAIFFISISLLSPIFRS